MALGSVLVDKARTISRRAQPTLVDGMPISATARSDWFKARLTLNSAPEERGPGGSWNHRAEQGATLIVKPTANGGCPIRLQDTVEVRSVQLGDATYRVVGEPNPYRKKRRVIGYEVAVERTDEAED